MLGGKYDMSHHDTQIETILAALEDECTTSWYKVDKKHGGDVRFLHLFGAAYLAAGAPRDATLYSGWEGTSLFYYFSPGCARFCQQLLADYSAVPCERPMPSRNLNRLAGALDCENLLSQR